MALPKIIFALLGLTFALHGFILARLIFVLHKLISVALCGLILVGDARAEFGGMLADFGAAHAHSDAECARFGAAR